MHPLWTQEDCTQRQHDQRCYFVVDTHDILELLPPFYKFVVQILVGRHSSCAAMINSSDFKPKDTNPWWIKTFSISSSLTLSLHLIVFSCQSLLRIPKGAGLARDFKFHSFCVFFPVHLNVGCVLFRIHLDSSFFVLFSCIETIFNIPSLKIIYFSV